MLAKKAERLRKETGDLRYYAPIEKLNWTFVKRLEHVLAKPFLILIREPMLIAITVYMSVSFTKKYIGKIVHSTLSLCMDAFISYLRRTQSFSKKITTSQQVFPV